jgi:exosortase
VVLALTGPLKAAVSVAATKLLFWLGFPVARSGVVVTIGQYQLLVSEACAGLQTMFTLEAMGLLYANLRSSGSWTLNTLLAVLVVPVSFMANVVRVVILMLVTYWFGDAVGQGFVHGFAGLVLFTVALLLIFGLDCGLRRLLGVREG